MRIEKSVVMAHLAKERDERLNLYPTSHVQLVIHAINRVALHHVGLCLNVRTPRSTTNDNAFHFEKLSRRWALVVMVVYFPTGHTGIIRANKF